MEDLSTDSEWFGDEGVSRRCTSLFGDTILEVCFGCVTISSTGDVWFIDTGFEFCWSLGVGTF